MAFTRLLIYIFVLAIFVLAFLGLIRFIIGRVRYRFSEEWQRETDKKQAKLYLVGGRVTEGLHLLAKHHLTWEIHRYLQNALPPSDVRTLIISTGNQLLNLKKSLAIAQQTGVPAPIVNHLGQETDHALEAVFATAHRFAAVHAQGIEFSKLGASLDKERDKLQRLATASEEMRETLAQWTLAGNDQQTTLQEAETRLRAFRLVTRDLMELA